MRLSSRRSDDADVIRARLRLLLTERDGTAGWLPEDVDAEHVPVDSRSPCAGSPADDSVDAPLTDEGDTGVVLPGGIGRHRPPGREARWDPGRPGVRALWITALAAALALAGWTWLDRPRVEPLEGAPAASSAPALPTVGEAAEASETVVVSVVGQVTNPGLVTLPAGSRVADALSAAGGLLPGADPASMNLAAVVSDGEQLAVGLPDSIGSSGASAGAATGAATGRRVDLNTADVAELDALPGIGPVLAQRIVEHRTRQGPFRSVEELDDVSGIGPAIAAELAELVTV